MQPVSVWKTGYQFEFCLSPRPPHLFCFLFCFSFLFFVFTVHFSNWGVYVTWMLTQSILYVYQRPRSVPHAMRHVGSFSPAKGLSVLSRGEWQWEYAPIQSYKMLKKACFSRTTSNNQIHRITDRPMNSSPSCQRMALPAATEPGGSISADDQKGQMQ